MREGIWRPEPPATEEAIRTLREQAPVQLPRAYLAQLADSNGGEGDLGVEPGWAVLWPAERVIENNAMYAIGDSLPGLYGIGSNGGGELIAFDTRARSPYPIVAVPWIPFDPELAILIARSFDEFKALLGQASRSPPSR